MFGRKAFSVVILLMITIPILATSTIYVGDLEVRLNSGGWINFMKDYRSSKSFMDWNFGNIYNIGISTGREYYISIRNTSNHPIGVYVFVDGLNSIGREKEGGSWWYLNPYQSFKLAGWQLDDEFRSNFEFVNIGDPSGQGGKYPGWIFIAQYRIRVPEPVHYRGMDRYSAQEADILAESKAAASMPGGAETGAGAVEPFPVEEVDYDLERNPKGLVAIHYGKKSETPVKPECDLWLGVDALSNVNNGVYVSFVYENSPAAHAGLEMGDVILSYNGKKCRYRQELHNMVLASYGGQRVILEVLNVRDKRIYDVVAWIGCR